MLELHKWPAGSSPLHNATCCTLLHANMSTTVDAVAVLPPPLLPPLGASGYDASYMDPLGQMMLSSEDFRSGHGSG
jgi:hypothetical protein